MYGSIFRMRIRPGRKDDTMAMFDAWWRERGPSVPGAVAGYVLSPDREPNAAVGVAIFADRASYHANAADPEQNQWYQRLRETLEDDPEWEDGEIASAMISPAATP